MGFPGSTLSFSVLLVDLGRQDLGSAQRSVAPVLRQRCLSVHPTPREW